jgi:hypothetical protein
LILQANFGPGIKSNDGPQTRKRNRSGPETEIDERARAAAGAKPKKHLAERHCIFEIENGGPEQPPQIAAVGELAGAQVMVQSD